MKDRDIIKPKNCRLCGASLKRPEVIGDFVYGGIPKQKFYHCWRCDIAFLFPSINKKQEQRFYAREFEKFMEKRTGKDFDWRGPESHFKSNEKTYKRRLRFLSDLISPGMSVLEIGCSSGFMLLPLKEKGLKVVGVEPSCSFTNFLRSHKVNVFDSLQALRNSEYGLNKFDLVMHFFVLEHVPDPTGFLKQGLKFLAPGGTMVFEVPSRSDPLITIYNIPAFNRFYWSVAHNYYFNKRSLEYLLKNVAKEFDIVPEQRYDISNHITWAKEGAPGGQGKYSAFFTRELEKEYLESMRKTGYCDTFICRIYKKTAI
jgi:2-polyprenyl-3-methyl-5-hydroxy-6-metoxy-1,4-benzoquinol methylase